MLHFLLRNLMQYNILMATFFVVRSPDKSTQLEIIMAFFFAMNYKKWTN